MANFERQVLFDINTEERVEVPFKEGKFVKVKMGMHIFKYY